MVKRKLSLILLYEKPFSLPHAPIIHRLHTRIIYHVRCFSKKKILILVFSLLSYSSFKEDIWSGILRDLPKRSRLFIGYGHGPWMSPRTWRHDLITEGMAHFGHKPWRPWAECNLENSLRTWFPCIQRRDVSQNGKKIINSYTHLQSLRTITMTA